VATAARQLRLQVGSKTYPLQVMTKQARLAEALGFAALWVHEHHSQAMMYPDPLMALAVLAPHTRQARLGTNMLLLPQWHPLRVAE
jgi:alkanesulfonate monooxygenase SsuD/methylene tetrahydromethanopterin reductase-like flavin-dependent oxidoreductase (luciferase family)